MESNNIKKTKSTVLVTDLLRLEGPQSQASISRKTGLSPAMVNNIVKELRELGAAEITWINGREGVVSLTSKHGKFISVLVTIEKIICVLFLMESKKKIVVETNISKDRPEDNNPSTVVNLIKDSLRTQGINISCISGIAVSIVASLDIDNETIISWSVFRLPGWRDVRIKSTLEKELGTMVIVGNDANHSTLAEWTWGVGRGVDNFVYINCARQIGGGIIIDGHLYKGGTGMAGEFGHLVIDSAGPVCICGCRGCLTTFISESAIIMNLSKSESHKGSLSEIIRSAEAGDAGCQRVLFEAGRDLGKALANVAKIMAPKMIAIGGELAGAGTIFFDSVINTVEEHNLGIVSPGIDFKPAQISNFPEILGGLAALLIDQNQGINELPEWIK